MIKPGHRAAAFFPLIFELTPQFHRDMMGLEGGRSSLVVENQDYDEI